MKKLSLLVMSLVLFLTGCSTLGTPNYSNTGTITYLNIYQVQEPRANIGGALLGGAAGGLVGNQFGQGHGKDAMTILGVMAGAAAGSQVAQEMQWVNKAEIEVRLDDGSRANISTDPSGLFVGKRVLVERYGQTTVIKNAN